MSEFSFAKKKTDDLSTLLLSDFMLFCSFILSHPLYFSYFIFFSPYLFKIFSFLSPLFLTTSLLLLAFFTLTPSFVNRDDNGFEYSPESKLSFLLTTYQTLVQTLRSKADEENDGFGCLEEFEVYQIVFETSTSTLETTENIDEVFETKAEEDCLQRPVEVEASIDKGLIMRCEKKSGNLDVSDVGSFQSQESRIGKILSAHPTFGTLRSCSLDEQPAEITPPETNQVKAVVKLFEEFLQEKDIGVENLSSKKKEKEVKPLSVEFKKGDHVQKGEETFMRSGSKAMGNNKINDINKVNNADSVRKGGSNVVLPSPDPHHQQNTAENIDQHAVAKAMANPGRARSNWSTENDDGDYNSNYYQTMGYSSPGNFGSMRREKEWRKTLACKLFEERQNGDVDGGERMDLLWETYDDQTDSNKVQMKNSSNKKLGKKKGGNYQYFDVDDYEDVYEEETDAPQLCCLQALKFSAGKMNLGMGRPNLVKISKALKGIGWLHHVSSRHAKKGYR